MIDVRRPNWIKVLPSILEDLPQQHVDGPAISVLMRVLGQGDEALPLATIAERTDLSLRDTERRQ